MVYESRAIYKYLAAKFDGQGLNLMSSTPQAKDYALLEQVIDLLAVPGPLIAKRSDI
mgnify:CR=1